MGVMAFETPIAGLIMRDAEHKTPAMQSRWRRQPAVEGRSRCPLLARSSVGRWGSDVHLEL